MNKSCYRIIFSRTHGELRVVSELARGCGTPPGQSKKTGAARLWVTLRRSIWLIELALFAGPVFANGIVADSQLAPEHRPEVTTTSNGVPQVNINAPNQAGVSHNQFQQFDVGHQGAILNNSPVNTSTQLGGYIQGNDKLNPNGAPASVIINEVNSNNPSQLRGFLEVAGSQAQVIVANPSGIICDGCGTINAGRLTLTTGKPQLNADGSVAGYQVEQGLIRVEGSGLNRSSRHDTGYVDIMARAVEINAGIWARERVIVTAGLNHISADGTVVKALSADEDKRPEIAIDMGHMGGMYSGRIRMVGTEAGVGVRNQGGQLLAENTLMVSSEGKLTWQSGTAKAFTHSGGDITLTARNSLEHHGTLYSGGKLTVQSRQGEIKQAGILAAAGNIQLSAKQPIQSCGLVLAGSDVNGKLTLPANITLNSQANIRASGSLTSRNRVGITGRHVNLSNGRLTAEHAELIAREGEIDLRQARVNCKRFNANNPLGINTAKAHISAGSWQITAESVFNQGGTWSQVDAGESSFTLGGELNNVEGSIEARRLSLNVGTLINLRGRLMALDDTAQHWCVKGLLTNRDGLLGSNGSLSLETDSLDNQGGTLQSQSHLALAAPRGVKNRRGKLLSNERLTLDSEQLINNLTGEIRGRDIQLTTLELDNNQGHIASQGLLRLGVHRSIKNQEGVFDSGGMLDISTEGGWENAAGTALSGQQMWIEAANLNNTRGKVQSGSTLTLKSTGNVVNDGGSLTAQRDLAWHGGTDSLLSNHGGKLLSGGALSLRGGQLANRDQGLVHSQKGLELYLDGAWDNECGTLTSGGGGRVRTYNLLNRKGKIQALDQLDMQFFHTLNNRHGKIISQGAQQLLAKNILNNQGWIGSEGTLTVDGRDFHNRQGNVVSRRDAHMSVTALDNHQGTLQSAAGLVLRVVTDITNPEWGNSEQTGLRLQGQENVALGGSINNVGGKLLAGKQLQVDAENIDNRQKGLIYSQQQLQLNLGDQFDNRHGLVQSEAGIYLGAGRLDNKLGAIDSKQQLILQLPGLLENTTGALRSGQELEISADLLQNYRGVVSSQGGLQLNALRLGNRAGAVISLGTGIYNLSELFNSRGKIHSGGAMTLNSEQMDNSTKGVITSRDALTVQTQALKNGDGGRINGTTHTDVTARVLDNVLGQVHSIGTLTLSLLDKLDNRHGRIIANNALSIQGADATTLTLVNQCGTIQSGGMLKVATNLLNNMGGTLLSQQPLTLNLHQDYAHRAEDTLHSNSAVTLNITGAMTNLAEWRLPGNLTVNSTHVNNLATLVGKNIQLTTGKLINKGRIEAESLVLDSDSTNNQAALLGGSLTLNGQIVENLGRHAVIAATKHLNLLTGERLTNRDGALIYSAGALQLTSDDLIENRGANIEAEGDITVKARRLDNLREGMEIVREAEQSGYKWHRYNYYWRSYDSHLNHCLASMAPTTQRLTYRDDHAADSNPYGTLININAPAKRAEVQMKHPWGPVTNHWVNYLSLTPNADGSHDMTFYETRGHRQSVQWLGSGFSRSLPITNVPSRYHNTVWRECDRGHIEQWDPERHLDIAAMPFVSDYNNFRERTLTGTLTTDKLASAGEGARLLSGGNMDLRISGRLLNDAGILSANGNLTASESADTINRGYSVNERRHEFMVDHYDRNTKHWYPTFNREQTVALATVDGIVSGNGKVSFSGKNLQNITDNPAQISVAQALQNAATAGRLEWQNNPLAANSEEADRQAIDLSASQASLPPTPGELALTTRQHQSSVVTSLPNNDLFSQHIAAKSPFLVVTDPRFAGKDKSISSNYLLQWVDFKLSLVPKRLGDGYYEQRMVRDQYLALTGRLSARGEDAMALYRSLMDNGINAAKQSNLVPGVALTAPQVAALRQDIVWPVSERVDTAGKPQTVWVPKVYLASGTRRLTGDGAVIAGGDLHLSTKNINNAGNLFADKAINIDSQQFMHQGGEIISNDAINVQANIISLSTNLQEAQRQASITARELSLIGREINLRGAGINTTDNLRLHATNNLNITTARSATTANLTVIAGSMGNRKDAGMEEAGSRMAHISGEWQQALGSSLAAGGNLSLEAGQDITLQGSQAGAGGNIEVKAKGNISLLADTTTNETHLLASSSTSAVENRRRADTLHASAISGDEGVDIHADGDFVAQGALVNSLAGGIGLSAQQVTIKEARRTLMESDSEHNREGNSQSQRLIQRAIDVSQGSVFNAGQGINVTAGQGDITIQGSRVQSKQGAIGLKAAGDISFSASRNEQHIKEQGRSSSNKVLGSSRSAYQLEERSSTASPSLLSGQTLSLHSGKDIHVMGSDIAATDDISLQAGGNLSVSAAKNYFELKAASQAQSSGISGTGGVGVSYGNKSLKTTQSGKTVTNTGSTVGSSQGSVTLTAGNTLLLQGSDVLAGKNLNVTGKEVNILAAENQRTQTNTLEQKQSGLTLALSGAVGSAVNSAVTSVAEISQESNGRMAALQGMKTALSGVQAVQSGVLAANKADDKNAVGVSLSYGSQSFKSEQTVSQMQSQGSQLMAGTDLSIHATQTDITAQGSKLQAGKDMTLQAPRDVNLRSARNTQSVKGKNESKGGSVGVGIGAGQGGCGINVSASINKGKGSEKGSEVIHTSSSLTSGRRLNINSGRDVALTGAQVNGETVTMDIGRNLTLTSEQGSSHYESMQQNVSAGASFSFGSMTGSGSVNVSQQKMRSNYDSVQDQSGIFAGKGGFAIKTGEHTQLAGAVIGSTAGAENNSLITGTLGFSNIENKADYQVEHQSVGISSGAGIGEQCMGNMLGNGMLSGTNGSDSSSSTTYSAISAGVITLRDQARQKQDVADLSRDVEHAHQTLTPIFNKEKEQQRLKEAQLISEIGRQVMDVASTQGRIIAVKAANEKMRHLRPEERIAAEAKWRTDNPGKKPSAEDINTHIYQAEFNQAFTATGFGTGGNLQRAFQAVTAAVQGLAGGDMAKALAGASAPYLAGVIRDMTTDPVTDRVNQEASLMAHAALGALVAQANGNSALAGATGAVMGEYIASKLYSDIKRKDLSEEQKQTISSLGTLAAGLAGGLVDDSLAGAVAGAQAGKNAVENNFLTGDDGRAFEKEWAECKATGGDCGAVRDKYAAINAQRNEELQQICADSPLTCASYQKQLVDTGMDAATRPEWMPDWFGAPIRDEEIRGVVQTENTHALEYINKNTDNWDRLGSFVAEPENVLGGAGMVKSALTKSATIIAKATGAALSLGANAGMQIYDGKTGDNFDYASLLTAGVSGVAGVGKSLNSNVRLNVGGAYFSSQVNGEDSKPAMVGAAVGSAVGYGVGTAITRSWEAKLVKEHFGMSASKNALKYSETVFGPGYLFKETKLSPVPGILGGVGAATTQEATGNAVQKSQNKG